MDVEPRVLRELEEQVDIPLDQRALRDHADRILVLEADLEALPRDQEVPLDRLVAIRDPREHHQLALPRLLVERLAQQLRRVPLHDDLRIEVRARAHVEILVRGPRVAVVADHAVRDEVTGARRDVDERAHAHRGDRLHPEATARLAPHPRRDRVGVRAEQHVIAVECGAWPLALADVAPAALAQEAMIGARHEVAAIGEHDPMRGLVRRPAIEHARAHVSPHSFLIAFRTDDLVAVHELVDPSRAPVREQHRRLGCHAVRTGMKTSAVRVRAPAEADVGRIVLREDRARLVLEQRDLRGRRPFAFVVGDGEVAEANERVGDRAGIHAS